MNTITVIALDTNRNLEKSGPQSITIDQNLADAILCHHQPETDDSERKRIPSPVVATQMQDLLDRDGHGIPGMDPNRAETQALEILALIARGRTQGINSLRWTTTSAGHGWQTAGQNNFAGTQQDSGPGGWTTHDRESRT